MKKKIMIQVLAYSAVAVACVVTMHVLFDPSGSVKETVIAMPEPVSPPKPEQVEPSQADIDWLNAHKDQPPASPSVPAKTVSHSYSMEVTGGTAGLPLDYATHLPIIYSGSRIGFEVAVYDNGVPLGNYQRQSEPDAPGVYGTGNGSLAMTVTSDQGSQTVYNSFGSKYVTDGNLTRSVMQYVYWNSYYAPSSTGSHSLTFSLPAFGISKTVILDVKVIDAN